MATKRPTNEAPVSTVRKLIAYRCLFDSEPWFVIWLHDDDILGVTDGKTKLFEKQLSTTERKELAGNVSESILPDKWSKLFDNRAFSLEMNGDDELEVSYIRGSVMLKKVKDATVVHERIAEILNHSIAGMMTFSKKLAEHEDKAKAQHIREYAAKRAHYRGPPKPPAQTRRPREQPTGLKFDDDDDE